MTEEQARRPAALAGLPALVLAAVMTLDLLVAEGPVGLAGLVVVVPLLAANVTDAWGTAVYGAVSWVVAALLGIRHGAYEPGSQLTVECIRLAVIALMAAAAIPLARDKIRREQHLTQVVKVAEAAQRAILLPVPEQLGPARVAVHYESAASDALIGGDLYGMVLSPFGLRVLVGDVRGKGLGAVRMSAQLLATFRERANDDPDLSVLMGRMDHTVERCATDDEDFVTAVLLQIDSTGLATMAIAGHPAPFALTQGRVRPVEPAMTRPPLGFGAPTETMTMRLGPGDRILLYTDGLTEARDPVNRAFLSSQIIVGALAADRDVAGALDALRADVLQWSGGRLHDDLALVLVEYVPQPDEESVLVLDADHAAEPTRTSTSSLS